MTTRRVSPSPFNEPVDRVDPFVDDEAPTRPGNIEYRAAMLVRNWRELSENDKRWLERLIEFMAWSKK